MRKTVLMSLLYCKIINKIILIIGIKAIKQYRKVILKHFSTFLL
jgi:hypothetical protein